MKILHKLGQAPEKSFRCFLTGLVFFIVGLALIYFNNNLSELQHMTGFLLVGLGCLTSLWGYLGIFSARLLVMMNRHPDTKR